MTQPVAGGQAAASSVAAKPSRSLRRIALLHAGSMTAFLVTLVAMVFVVPVIFEGEEERRAAYDVAFTLLLLTGAAAVVELRPMPLAAAVLCVVAIAIRWSEWLLPAGVSTLAREGASLLALLLLLSIVGVRVFAGGAVTADRIMGAVALYLLLGIGWSVAYELVSVHVPGAFTGDTPGRGPDRWLYFSFVTLTTVGYGDITPVARAARSLAALEALVGQLYPAIILARLVTLQGDAGERGGK